MPMHPSITAAIDRIRSMQKKPAFGQWQPTDPIPYQAPAPTINVGEMDTSGSLPPMDMPTEAQINTPVYGTGNETYGMGPKQTFAAPKPQSKRDSIAAAHQIRLGRKQIGYP